MKRFDDWYLAYYPYLASHIPFAAMTGRDVLEIGLGYGTVSQKIAEGGARYCGLDIACGPVDMVNHRLRQAGLPGEAKQGSVLAAPFPDESFDYVVSIGCLHHTGSVRDALAECHRILRPKGVFTFMVYNAYSYRRWWQAPRATLRYLAQEIGGYRGVITAATSAERGAYDTDQTGATAPHTDWISVKSLRRLCQNFSDFSATRENFAEEPPFGRTSRDRLLNTFIPAIAGLDIYVSATK